jgi:hypothetical protein
MFPEGSVDHAEHHCVLPGASFNCDQSSSS